MENQGIFVPVSGTSSSITPTCMQREPSCGRSGGDYKIAGCCPRMPATGRAMTSARPPRKDQAPSAAPPCAPAHPAAPCHVVIRPYAWQPYARSFQPAYVLLNNQATDRLTDDLLKPACRLALVLVRKSITMRTTPTAYPRAFKGSGAVRTTRPASIPSESRPTFQIFIVRNVSRRRYRGVPGVKE